MACVAVNSLIRTIELEFMQPQPRPILQEMELIPSNKELIQSLHEKLGFLIELFDKNRMDGVEAIKELETKLRDVAFRVEVEIELHVVDLYEEAEGYVIANLFGDTEVIKTWYSHRLRQILQQAIEDIDAIKEELEKVTMEYKHVIAVQGWKTTVDVIPKSDELVKMDGSSKHASHTEDIMVGKNNEFHTIRKMLIEHPSKQREVVSIKGMGGIGKTTLARRVYEDPSIVSHFDKRVWVVASQHHNKLEMLKGLLKTLGCGDNGTEGELAEQLYQNLMRQRYLVVIDDVWSDDAWDAVKACFPDNGNRSRVLLTTRIAEVATRIGSNHDFSHQMHLLDQSESWNLFREKACKSRGAEFETIGRLIVEKCKGLPLAIVVVAGLFSKLDTLIEWKNIVEALNSSTRTTIDEECSKILSLSYNHLPHNLKACFLYLGVFPEDEEIDANDLARLWAAEGLVKAFKNESFEAVARRYIKELMDRNLILVSIRSCCGRKIKAFRVHDLLHAFCVRESQNQSLLHVVYESGSNLPHKGVRWVRIQSKGFDISALHSCSKNCRSIFYFVSEPASLNLKIFNLWRVLYFTSFQMRKKTVDLVHLRYLSARDATDRCDVLFKAWNLQTLCVYADIGRNILEFPQLQNSHCRRFYGNSPKFVHQNLQTIYALEPKHCTQEYLTKIPYLKKVSIRSESNDCNECIKNLVYLQQLESLRILVDILRYDLPDMVPINNNILLLKNLRKLTFVYMKFEWNAINVFSKLPRLEVLKLLRSNVGEKWELPENEKFCQLICLQIWYTHLKHWKVSANHFPKLERLLLSDCFELREIPNSFVEIPTLNLIELENCLPSAVMSAKQIQAEQHDYGNENMVVIEKDTRQPSYGEDERDEDEE